MSYECLPHIPPSGTPIIGRNTLGSYDIPSVGAQFYFTTYPVSGRSFTLRHAQCRGAISLYDIPSVGAQFHFTTYPVSGAVSLYDIPSVGAQFYFTTYPVSGRSFTVRQTQCRGANLLYDIPSDGAHFHDIPGSRTNTYWNQICNIPKPTVLCNSMYHASRYLTPTFRTVRER